MKQCINCTVKTECIRKDTQFYEFKKTIHKGIVFVMCADEFMYNAAFQQLMIKQHVNFIFFNMTTQRTKGLVVMTSVANSANSYRNQ